ncbi:hypothetical protein L7F22_007991 [Adiantum nelumboides]|nr:hypothetical protein [Adiantum nelumboides]
MPTIAHNIMAERYFAGEQGQDVWAWIRLVEREMQYLGIEDDEAKADYAHQGLEREAYDMYNWLVEDAQCCWNTLKLVLVLMYWELPMLAESDDFVESFYAMYKETREELLHWLIIPGSHLSYVGTYEGDGMSENNKKNLSWHDSMTLDAFDELHDANIDFVDSNCFDAKLETYFYPSSDGGILKLRVLLTMKMSSAHARTKLSVEADDEMVGSMPQTPLPGLGADEGKSLRTNEGIEPRSNAEVPFHNAQENVKEDESIMIQITRIMVISKKDLLVELGKLKRSTHYEEDESQRQPAEIWWSISRAEKHACFETRLQSTGEATNSKEQSVDDESGEHVAAVKEGYRGSDEGESMPSQQQSGSAVQGLRNVVASKLGDGESMQSQHGHLFQYNESMRKQRCL